MIETLKTASEKLSNFFLERFKSSTSSPERDLKEINSKGLKRRRERKLLDECSMQLDMLETPPEKRIKQINDESDCSPSQKFSTFKDFIDSTKAWKRNFLLKYIVQGNTGIDTNQDQNLVRSNSANHQMEKNAAFSIKKTNDILLASPWEFRKPGEPSVKFRNPETQAATKRRPLHPEKLNAHKSYRSQTDQEKRRPVVTDKPCSLALSPTDDAASVLPAAISKSEDNHSVENSLSYLMQKTRKMTTIDTVVRLEERDIYRKLLAEYTSFQDSSAFESSGLCSSLPKANYSRSSFAANEDYPRLKNADSILSKYSLAVADTSKSNVVLSSARFIPEVSLLQDATEATRNDRKGASFSSSFSRDKYKTFSGTDTVNVTRDRGETTKDEDIFGNSWTKHWKSILSSDELERQKRIAKEEKKLDDLAKKKKEREIRLLRRIDARKELDQRKGEEKLPVLTPEMESVVSNALRKGSPSENLVEGFNMGITRHDIATLANLNWLNDEVVNFYFNLLQERSNQPGKLKMHFFNSFFYPKLLRTGYSGVRRWTKKVDIFSMDIVVLPVHLGMHWCLAAIDIRKKQIAYYDSLKGNNKQCIAALRNYIVEEHKDKKKACLNIHEWTEILPKNIPEQLNGCDCGVFTCKYADCLTRDSPLNFSQDDMPYFRRRMIFEILKKNLLQ